MATRTIEDQLIDTKGRSTGFDYLRIVLATTIVAWHTIIVCGGESAQFAVATGWSRPFWAAIVPMFFALSGFLVSGSLERSKTPISFIGLRVIRLLPALIVESILAMALLGSIFTTLHLGQYFKNGQTWAYLWNIVGQIHYFLPGVFKSNPDTYVNAQLWTLPLELDCYACIFAIACAMGYRFKWALVCIVAALQAIVVYRYFAHPTPDEGVLKGFPVVLAFLYGVVIYRFRSAIPYDWRLFAIAFVTSAVLLNFHVTERFAPLPVAYVTVWLGLTNPKLISILKTGDYSYPTFLYGYPIQQAAWALTPLAHSRIGNFLVSIGPIYFVAWLSWTFIEKKASAIGRPRLFRFEAAILDQLRVTRRFVGQRLPAIMRSRWGSQRPDEI